MTADEIRAAVQASPQLKRLAVVGNTTAIAAFLGATAGRVQAGDVLTPRAVSGRFPAVAGLPGPLAFEAAVMALEGYATLNAGSAVQRSRLLARGIRRMLEVFPTIGLDFGASALRDTLDALTPDVLSADQVAAFKSLARLAPAQTSARQVGAALGQVLPDAPRDPPTWI